MLSRLQHHTLPEGEIPHEPDRGAAAGFGGTDGGRVHALHHDQAVRRIPISHKWHHVSGGCTWTRTLELEKGCTVMKNHSRFP